MTTLLQKFKKITNHGIAGCVTSIFKDEQIESKINDHGLSSRMTELESLRKQQIISNKAFAEQNQKKQKDLVQIL